MSNKKLSNEADPTALNKGDVSETLVCKKCGHPICPHCGDWCDVILYSKEDKGNHCDAEDENDYPAPCCGGTCEF